jgi:nucleotide-binding universal stress UspA family protein
MAIAFDNILIPVDFSLNTEVAVKRAVEMAGSEGALLHLLHVMKPGRKAKHQFTCWAAEKELDKWRETIMERYPPIRVMTHVLRGRSVREMIIEYARSLKPDLIVIGKNNPPRPWFFFRRVWPGAIAKQSNCPVLTVKPGSADSRTKIILIPIRDFLPERKLEWAILLAKKYRAQVHLLAIQDDVDARDWALPQVFLKAYHHLREALHRPIKYSATGRQSMAKAALDCAKLIRADMILLDPETESGMSALAGYRHISDRLRSDSKIQVLDVEPYKTN